MEDAQADTTSILESVIHHIALPPRLPGKEDKCVDQIECSLQDRLLDASRILKTVTEAELSHQWDCIRVVLQISKEAYTGGSLNKASLVTNFQSIDYKHPLILHVTEQNAGLLIRRCHEVDGDIVIFEAFEASPLSEMALAAENALTWDFPGSAVAIPYSEFSSISFLENLAGFLEQASTESIKRFAASTNKAGSSAYESRDTVDPSLITQMLTALLEVKGHRIFPPLLRKRIRDDICWAGGAEKPWRRSAHWLVLRVGLARHLNFVYGATVGRVYYKFLLCIVLRNLIDDALEHVGPELLKFLQAKLACRLAKLQFEEETVLPEVHSASTSMFAILGTLFDKTIVKVNQRVEGIWNHFKKTVRRPIHVLRRRADQRHLHLTLSNSQHYLQQVLRHHEHMLNGHRSLAAHRPTEQFDLSVTTVDKFSVFAHHYFSLSELEIEIEQSHLVAPHSKANHEELCIKLSENILFYLNAVAGAYDSNSEQKSMMILIVMELWVSMDQCASELFHLLVDYSSGFRPTILDVLQLPCLTEMSRLQKVQEYLREREAKSKFPHKTIFDNPATGCFAERYFDGSSRLHALLQSIETAAASSRSKKEEQWERLSTEYRGLRKSYSESTCVYTTTSGSVVHDDPRCRKCYLRRSSNRMRIDVHEHPLPSNPARAKAVIFELKCPKAFGAYRNATWRIISALARAKHNQHLEPCLILCDYTELEVFMDYTPKHGVCLASRKKSFLSTHYDKIRFPVSLDKVCVPNGLEWEYFDPLTKVWPAGSVQEIGFSDNCQINIPAKSPLSSLQFSPTFAADSNGPSSYEILASQTKCPSGLNVNEFMAYQALFAGKTRRWPSILIELGSSNLNFSTEATSSLISQLALQAGPAFKLDPLRATHRIFRDFDFCRSLIRQVNLRLDGIISNWREIDCMEMLLTLILRLCFISPKPIVCEATALLEKARSATLNWMRLLRMEIQKSMSAETSRRCSRYAFWATLLCRRTFDVCARKSSDNVESKELQPAAFECFIECSITLQDNLAGDPGALPLFSKNSLIRDIKMVYRMRSVLRKSLESSPDSVSAAISNVWQHTWNGTRRSFAKPIFLEPPYDWWVILTVHGTHQKKQQTIHYHLLQGHLLVDGQLVAKLPPEHRGSLILEQLFGKQSLLTYPSGLYGMSYALAFKVNGYQVHIGVRNNSLVVQALARDTLLELIPREIFGNSSNFDLPSSLVGTCVHWLDLHTGIMEIRQQPDIWKSKQSNWRLDFPARTACRRTSFLVDPHSPTFQQIARTFDRFEDSGRLTVFQPEKGSLSVELRRLELSFFVNKRNLLECRQLRSEIDPDQDAGTWYGLNSKLVMRDATNPRQRSVLVPMGSISYQRNGCHVAVQVQYDNTYGRFAINDVLGRLDCPAEPRILYLKALLHACTSFVIPDPLTGRTGTEEALQCLKLGCSQPWSPLTSRPLEVLTSIAKLTPVRQYYPRDMKVMQQVFWDPHLTTTIQHDDFRPTVEAIVTQSQLLSRFALKKTKLPSLELVEDSSHLLHRNSVRFRLYQRARFEQSHQCATSDMPYSARNCGQDSQPCCNVFESASLIRDWPSSSPNLSITSDLATHLEEWPLIGGCDRQFNHFLLSDLLELDIGPEWGSLINVCRSSGPMNMDRLMFLFALISFRAEINMEIVRALIAFATLDSLKSLEPPKWPYYVDFVRDHIPSADELMQLMKECCVSYPDNEQGTLQMKTSLKERRKLEAAVTAHEKKARSECKALAENFLQQWPCMEPTIEDFPTYTLVDVSQALDIVRPEWLRLFQNAELSNYVERVQHVLDRHRTAKILKPPARPRSKQEVFPASCRVGESLVLLKDLLRKAGPATSQDPNQGSLTGQDRPASGIIQDNTPAFTRENLNSKRLEKRLQVKHETVSVFRETRELETILDGVTRSKSKVQQQYGRELKRSLDMLKILQDAPKDEEPILPANMSTEIAKAQQAIREGFNRIRTALESDDPRFQWLRKAGLGPCITSISLLEQLRSTSTAIFGGGMKESIVAYGVSITQLQHLLRIEDAQRKGNDQRLLEEKLNLGHGNWQPTKYPDWLLLEIDSNFLIRHDQVDVALATISPASGSNSVLQMNMGQGKTSCIMPMVAAVLADSKTLLRVVVPQSLLLQTAQVLQARLGGLVGREVRHVPFSRKTPTDLDTVNAFSNIHESLRITSGVVVALPEQILSFMLSGLQRLSDGRISEATKLLEIQSWNLKYCRDVLDECDFTLAVRTQLIYPSGPQIAVDGHPHRWETAEALLQLVDGHLWNLQQDFPQSIEVVRRPQGGLPMIFFLRKDAEDALISRLVTDIVQGRTSILSTRDFTQSDRNAIQQFISETTVRPAVTKQIHQTFIEKSTARHNIFLLRGLLVHRILLMTLKKRWNVQYGLHPYRDPVAVPFHAKGVPSEQAEWGHPDVAILFTCLAFYLGGLNVNQLRQSLEHIVKSDDPSSEYDRWTSSTTTLPSSLREWNGINVDDEAQLTEIWQHVRHKIVVIDYFLNHFVFPKHAKQFEIKMQASGWDIPLCPQERNLSTIQRAGGQSIGPMTTGFSGTNDNRSLLPLNIRQEDLYGLSHTNAEVLTYLLQHRNRTYVVAADAGGRHLSELDFLRLLRRLKIRMLIDAGAQILEMDNRSLVTAWLTIDCEAPAAVYFNAENKPFVLYRNDSQVPLVATPFAENLDLCLVYLDEAHTRGTDLKMPANARGALTLGLGQTKDHTVQAAMRLRQLATSQSILFLAPPEVHQSILDLRKKQAGDSMDSSDVIWWLLEQTCIGIEQTQPLYFAHGVSYCNRTQAALDNPNFLLDSKQRDSYLNVLRESEEQTLEVVYKPRSTSKKTTTVGRFSPGIAAFIKELNTRREDFQDFGNAVHATALQEVEQEREVAFEVEAVREVQKPLHFSPMSFLGLQKDIASFAETGRLPAGSEACEHMLMALQRTALGSKYEIRSGTPASKLFLSKEFTRTVRLPNDRRNDSFMRQVTWILWSVVTETALVIIPEEAEILIPIVQNAKEPLTHLLTYAAPVTRKMLHFNNLNYYAMPALPAGWRPPKWLTIELGIFAGRLYFEFEEYSDMRKYLGLGDSNLNLSEPLDNAALGAKLNGIGGVLTGTPVQTDLRVDAQQAHSFTAKPLAFLQEWLALRRKGQDFTHTPMGYVCQGKPLRASHPFFTNVNDDLVPKNAAPATSKGDKEEEDAKVSDMGYEVGDSGVEDMFDEEDDETGMIQESELSDGDGSVSGSGAS